ncbi:neuronal acetylcholine receptor subunit alpha-7-like [Macrobrachium rosenbergii]|uniref:neuronal acetylcholine receptor subunit alpha-7-like n=1 Tax=Macrobrachium rosenbergii TaxID=79674 RepID=UPI0034D44723
MFLKIVIFICAFALQLLVVDGYLLQDYIMKEQEVRNSIMRNYDKTTMPAKLTTVRLRRITIKHFDMDEISHTLAVDAWFIYEWTDPRLKFQPTLDVLKLSMSPNDIWMPDLKLYNDAHPGAVTLFDDTLTLVYPDGRVLHAPPARLHTTCVADLTLWPHDQHNCSIVLGSWVHHGHTIDLRLLENKPKVDLSQQQTPEGKNISRGEWELVMTSLIRKENSYECCPEPYVSVWLTLVVVRDAPAFNWTVKVPVVGLSVLSILLFLLPPAAGEKLILGGLCLLMDLVYIETVTTTVAHSPSHTPLIIQLVCQQFVLVLVSVIIGCIVYRMVHEPHIGGLPTILHRPLSKMATLLCLKGYNNLVSGFRRTLPRSLKSEELELGNGNAIPHSVNDSMIRNEWLFLGALIDRICLILCFTICLLNFIRFHNVL